MACFYHSLDCEMNKKGLTFQDDRSRAERYIQLQNLELDLIALIVMVLVFHLMCH